MARRRYQRPKVHRTKGERPQWYFRARVDVRVSKEEIGRPQKRYYLGYCDEMGKREAEKARDAVLGEVINQPQVLIQSQVLFSEVVTAYKRIHMPTVRAITRLAYEQKIDKYILPAFGAKRMCDINYEAVQRWANGLQLAHSSKANVVAILGALWKKARRMGYTQSATPTEGIMITGKQEVYERRIFTREEFRKLVALLAEPYGSMAQLAVFSGLRISEIRGLEWRCVDLSAETIRVEQRLDLLDEVDDPKTRKSRRIVKVRGLASMLPKPGKGLVFPGAGTYNCCTYAIKAAAIAAGCDWQGMGWHTFRRCLNSWLRKHGSNEWDAMEQLGHRDRRINDLYVVAETGDLDRRAENVDRVRAWLLGDARGGVQ